MADQPAGFSSPMGGSGKKASAAAAAALNDLKSSAKSYADNMERAAKAAERAAHAQIKGGGGGAFFSNLLGQGSPVTGGSVNGGGSNIPSAGSGAHWINQHQAGSPFPMIGSRPAGFGGGMGATLDRPANGGGASMPTFDQRVAARTEDLRVEQQARKAVNGGGGVFGAVRSSLVAAGGAAIGAAVASTDTYKSYDYLANRIALLNAGAYSKRSGAMTLRNDLGGAFRNNAEMNAQAGALMNGGFTPGSAGWSSQASTIQSISRLDPMAAGTAGQVATSFQGPEMFNRMRMFGIDTMGAGGAPRSVNDIAKQLYQRSAMQAGVDPSRAPSTANVAAYFGPNGSLATTARLNGWNEDQTAAVRTSLLASANAGHFVTDKEVKGGKNPFGNTMYGADQTREKGTATLITAGLKEFADGYIKANEAIGSALTHLGHTLDALPGAIREAIMAPQGAMGALAHGGGGVSNSIGGSLVGGIGAGLSYGASRALGRAGARTAARGGGRLLRGGIIAAAGDIAGGAITHIGKHNGKDNVWADVGGTAVKGAAYGALLGPEGAAAGAALGGLYGLASNKGWLPWGDGPGRGGAHSSTSFPGLGAGSFRGQEWGDGPGSASSQSAAAKARGGDTVDVLEELLKGYKGGARVTSTRRSGKSGVTVSGNVSYHATGNAIDIAANTPGKDSPELLAINKYFAQYASGLNELIYAGPGGTLVKDGRKVGAGFYGQDVMNIHHNHVHVAATKAMLKKLKKKKGGGFLGSILGGIEGAASAVGHAVGSAAHGVESLFGGGKGKPSTSTSSSASAPSLGSLLSRRGAGGGGTYSQASLVEQLLSDVGPSFGTDLGSHRTTVDPSESDDANGSAAQTGAVTSMPTGNAHDNAMTIIKVAKAMGISKRGAIIGIATAEQESGLINLHSGDRDSQGLFQQRPSQGWGTVAEVTNPEHSARKFFESLKGLDYNKLPLTVAAQKVQRSAYPNAYAKWEDTATGIVNGSHVYGDGPGRAGASAATVAADVPTPRAHMAPGGGGGNMTVHSRGGSSITIGKVEVHLTTPQVSPQEARRIGKMVTDEIAAQTRMKEMSR